jgi:hypothetical protein
MKRLVGVLVLIAISTLALAQTPAVSGSGPGPASPSNSAGQQTPSAEQTQPPAQPTGKHQPVPKTPEEFKAYQDAATKPDGPSAEAAAEDFAQKYPQSELRGALYQRSMGLYQNANNSDKTIEMGHKALAAEPDNAPALVTIATFLATRTRETDLDRDERLAEAKKDAARVIELANAGEAVPAGTPPEQAAAYKDTLLSMSYAALGAIDFNEKNYPSAEQNLKKSVAQSKAQPDPVSYYQLALTLQRENKPPDALDAANKCIDSAKDSPEVANACKNLQTYLQKIVSNPPAKPAAPAAAPAAPAPSPAPPSK